MKYKFSIRNAQPKDLGDIQKFRYDVIYHVDRRISPCSDPITQKISDPFDQHSDIFIATRGEQIAGTIRTTLIQSDNHDFWEKTFGVQIPKSEYRLQSFTSRLVVRPEYRCLQLFDQLAKNVFLANLEKKVVHGYAACRPELVPLFKKYGWKNCHDDDHSTFRLLALDTQNIQHLEHCKSPFLNLI